MWQKFFIGIGRIFLAYVFIIGAVNKILNWSAMEDHTSDMFADWQGYVTGIGSLEALFDILAPMSTVLLGIALGLELICGVFVLMGFKPKWGAICLILFLIPTTLLYHHFWYLDGEAREVELVAFMKNMAILGGLLILWAGTSLIERLKAHT